MPKQWTGGAIMELVWGFQPACVIVAAAELDLFTALHQPATAGEIAARSQSDARGVAVLLDALAALQVLVKRGEAYALAPGVAEVLAEGGEHSMLGMARHMGNCLRRWGQLAHVVQSGRPVEREVSVRGPEEDLRSFIRAMHEISDPVAPGLIESLGPLAFTHLLDLGGASGTWTVPFLRRYPAARATIFDRPEVVPLAEDLLRRVGLADRARVVAGDFERDPLPPGADLAWVSAIVHQNSREQNRHLFRKVFAALPPGGRILIRDVVMAEGRTAPVMGALFAVNMLVATPGGGTFTFSELREDLETAGFAEVAFLRRGEAMDAVLTATKHA